MKSSPEMNLLPPDAACHPSPIQFPMKKRRLSQFVNPSFVKDGKKKSTNIKYGQKVVMYKRMTPTM